MLQPGFIRVIQHYLLSVQVIMTDTQTIPTNLKHTGDVSPYREGFKRGVARGIVYNSVCCSIDHV